MDEDEDSLFATVSRALECVEGWCAHWSPVCLRAVLGDDATPSTSGGTAGDDDDDDDRARALADALLIAARRAAPAILAVERFARERRARCGGASTTVVELCGASRGHLLGALIASMRLEGVERVVLVDPRWPRAGAGDDASAASVPKKTDDARLPTAHVDARVDGWWTHRGVPPPHRWKASAKNASHLRSLAAALRRARCVAEPDAFASAIAIVANAVGGTCDLRALQLYHAPYGNRTLDLADDADVALAMFPGDPPERNEARRRNLTYRAGPTHEFSVKRLWPPGGRHGGGRRGESVDAFARKAWAAHVLVGSGGVGVASKSSDGFHDDDPPLVTATRASAREVGRGAEEGADGGAEGDPFRAVALSVVEQLAAVNARVVAYLRRAGILRGDDRYDRYDDDDDDDVMLRRVDPGAWVAGGYCEHHYVPEPPGPHSLCFEALVGANRQPAGFVAFSAYDADDEDGRDVGVAGEDDEHAGDAPPGDERVARPGGSLTNAQVDRLCVLPARRRRGIKERLLRCADGFHAIGVPVRVKTASRSAAGSFVRCALLAYDGFKDPTRAGVSKRRGTKTFVVVDDASSRERDERRYEDDWRNREVGQSIPVAAETPNEEPEAQEGEPEGCGRGRAGNVEGDGRDRESHGAAIRRSDGDRRSAATRAALNRVAPDTVVAVADTIASSLAAAFTDHDRAGFGDDDAGTRAPPPPEVSSTAALVAVRGARDGMYRATYADVVARVAAVLLAGSTTDRRRHDVFVSAVVSAASAPLVRCAAGKGGADLAGFASFFAELATRGLVANDDARGAVSSLVAGVRAEMDGSVAVDAATCAPALCAAIEGELGLGLAGVRKEGNEGQEGNEGREGADSVGVAVRDALARAHAGDGVNLGGRLRFLAGRALAALESADAARGVGRRNWGFAPFDGDGGAFQQRSAPFIGGAMTRAEVHHVASREMRCEVVLAGSRKAVDRGMRRGWTFAYVGSPVRIPNGSNDTDFCRVFVPSRAVRDPAELTDEADAHPKGRYERVRRAAAAAREWPRDGLPRTPPPPSS